MSTKSTYLEFLKPLITKPTSIENLEKNLGIEIEKQLWQSFFVRVRKYTKNRHYRVLQYKVIHNIHNTKKNLKKWGIKPDDICDLCYQEVIENNDHYFLGCSFNHRILQSLTQKIMNILEVNIKITDVEYITGLWITEQYDKTLRLIDKIMFYCRIFIILSRRRNRKINLLSVTNFFIEEFNLEDQIVQSRRSQIFINIAWDIILKTI